MLLCESAGCTSAKGGVSDFDTSGGGREVFVLSASVRVSIILSSRLSSRFNTLLDCVVCIGSGVGERDLVGSNGSYASGELGGEFGGSGGVLGPLCKASATSCVFSSSGSISSGSWRGFEIALICVCLDKENFT